MTDTKLPIKPERSYTWEQWQAGRAETTARQSGGFGGDPAEEK